MGNRFVMPRDKFRDALKRAVDELQAKYKISDREVAEILEGSAEIRKEAWRSQERAARQAKRDATLAAETALEAAAAAVKAKPALPPAQRNGKRG